MKKSIASLLGAITCIMLFSFSNRKLDYETKRNNFVEKVNSQNWENPDLARSLITEWIRLEIDKNSKQSLGLSRFGGTPDLSNTTEWPVFENNPMVFLAQINLKQLSTFHKNNSLPHTGMLYFFAHFNEPDGDYGAEFEFRMNHQEYKVIYAEDMSNLQSTRFPDKLSPHYRFEGFNTSFETSFQLPPSSESIQIETSAFSTSDIKTLDQFNAIEDVGLRNQLLGIPPAAQAPLDFDWSMSYLKIDYSELENKRTIVDNTRKEFVNLLSFQLFEKIGYAQAYFGITQQDLERKEFGKSILILQSE